MNSKELESDKSGSLTNEFEEIEAGRRVVLEFPVPSSIPHCNTVTAVVLDSEMVTARDSCECAAMLVPLNKEEEWVYSSESGQWQLLASAGVSRLIVLLRNRKQVGFENKLDQLAEGIKEDEELKKILRPLVLALTPRVLFNLGIPDIPFLTYTDNVAQRLEIEVAYSPLTGLIMVQDVELKPESEIEEELTSVSKTSPRLLGKVYGSSPLVSRSSKPSNIWRRRLIFQRMPNLIQTEVSLVLDQCKEISIKERKRVKESKSRWKRSGQARNEIKRVVDHSRLVHKYLPPMVAGFVLISPCLDEYVRSQLRAKVLCIGVGGGALPTFLHNQFGFHIQVVDLDEVVLDLARKHFGLRDGPNLEVTLGDGLVAVTKIAGRALQEGLVDNDLLTTWKLMSSDHNPHMCLSTPESNSRIASIKETRSTSERNLSPVEVLLSISQEGNSSNDWVEDSECRTKSECTNDDARGGTVANDTTTSRCSKLDIVARSTHSQGGVPSSKMVQSTSKYRNHLDPRVEIIIVDVDVGDARLELSSPPLAFLEQRFLLLVRIALKEGGMLVMNVVPCRKKAYECVIVALTAVFEEVYEILLDNEVHHCIVFALPKPGCYPCLVGPTLEQVERLVNGRLIQQIRKLKRENALISQTA